MNKGLFFSGLGILVFELLGFLFYLTKDIQVSESTGNIIISGLFFGLLTIASIVLMIVGSLQEDK